MPVYLSTKAFELLQKRQTSEQTCRRFVNQRAHVYSLQNTLTDELQRQFRLQEQKKRELFTGSFPVIPPKNKREENQRYKTYFKTLNNRIPSATRTRSGRQVSLCDRDKEMKDFEMGRHFCELLGPSFCIDCTKAREREEALRECEENPPSFNLERDPFTALVCNHLTREVNDKDSNEEICDDESSDQDELSDLEELITEKRDLHAVSNVVFTPSPIGKGIQRYPSPPRRVDSGYSSRLSHIREFTRAQSCSILRSLPLSFSPIRREKTQAPTSKPKPADSRQSSGYVSPTREYPEEYSPKSCSFLDTIQKLQKRKELNRHRIDASKSWLKGPVEPVLMELKLINFTQYDKLGYEPPPKEPEPQAPVYAVDEFGFPIMENIKSIAMQKVT